MKAKRIMFAGLLSMLFASCSTSDPSSTSNPSGNSDTQSISVINAGDSSGNVGTVSLPKYETPNLYFPEMMKLSDLKANYTVNSPLEINFWTGFGRDITSGLVETISEFQDKYPFIRVKHESKGGINGLEKAVTLAISSAAYPQVVLGYPDHFAGYITSGIQSSLDNYITSSDKNIEVDIDDFNQDYLRENKELAFKENGTPYTVGLPFNRSAEVMVYNKTLFDVLGETVPTTWDEAVTVSASILTKMEPIYGKKVYVLDDRNPIVIAYADANGAKDPQGNTVVVPSNIDPVLDFSGVAKKDFLPMGYDSPSNFFITAAKQWGGEYTVAGEDLTKGYIKFNHEKTKEALSFFKTMNTNKQLGVPYTWEEESYCSVPFKSLKTAMTISSSDGLAYNLASGLAFEVGIAPIPYKTADKKAVISQGTNLAMLKSNKEKSLASWLLIRYLCTTGNPNFAIETGYLPVTTSGENSEEYQEFLNLKTGTTTDMVRIAAAKVAKDVYGATGANAWTRFVDPAFRGSSSVRAEIEAAIPMVFYGDNGTSKTIDEVIDYLYTKLSLYVHPDDKK